MRRISISTSSLIYISKFFILWPTVIKATLYLCRFPEIWFCFDDVQFSLTYVESRDVARQWSAVHIDIQIILIIIIICISMAVHNKNKNIISELNRSKQRSLNETFKTRWTISIQKKIPTKRGYASTTGFFLLLKIQSWQTVFNISPVCECHFSPPSPPFLSPSPPTPPAYSSPLTLLPLDSYSFAFPFVRSLSFQESWGKFLIFSIFCIWLLYSPRHNISGILCIWSTFYLFFL